MKNYPYDFKFLCDAYIQSGDFEILLSMYVHHDIINKVCEQVYFLLLFVAVQLEWSSMKR